jgi:hypothetical protein
MWRKAGPAWSSHWIRHHIEQLIVHCNIFVAMHKIELTNGPKNLALPVVHAWTLAVRGTINEALMRKARCGGRRIWQAK